MLSSEYFVMLRNTVSVCEEVCGERSAFGGEEEPLLAGVCSVEEARAFVSSVEAAAALEERLKAWMRQVHAVVMESQQLRTENDSSGPQDELEYWKRRAAHFAQIVAKLQSHEVQFWVVWFSTVHFNRNCSFHCYQIFGLVQFSIV